MMVSRPRDERIAQFESFGMFGEIAEAHADAVTAEMGECILTLYRSAVQPAMADLATRLRGAAVRPSLIVIAEEDIYVPSSLCEAAAADLGSAVVRFPDQGHWWMIGAAAAAADALVEFWAGLG